MNRVFYIFRHGETDWNKERRCQGHTDTSLNETGQHQARMLAERLVDFKLDLVVSSDLARALMTGTIVAERKGIPLIVDRRLREMSYGEAEGMRFDEAVKQFGEEIWNKLGSFRREHDHVGFPGGETRFSARERFHQALIDIIENSNHECIGISTHGGALRNILHYFLPENHAILPIPNCVIYRCVYDSENKQFSVDPRAL